MFSKLMRCTENCNACSQHRSTERVQFFMTMPDGTTPIAQPLHQKWNELGYKLLPHLLYSPDLSPTDYHFKHIDNFLQRKCFYNQQKVENAFQSLLKSQSTDFYITEINVGKNVLIVMVPILSNKDVFEPTYNDLKFTAPNYIYFCTNLIYLVGNAHIRSESHTLSQKRVMLTALIVGIRILELT